ncbi:MAG TPA: hypothetical protein VF680_17060 [Allosphingosinicella sp.]
MEDQKIYLKLDKRPWNVKEVIEALYDKDRGYGQLNAVTTYSDKECTIKQCIRNRRSPDDIYYLCKTYFPNVTMKKVMHEILCFDRKDKEGKPFNMQLYNCITMQRLRVIPMRMDDMQNYVNIVNYTNYQSPWTWKELLDMVGIKSNEDLKNYREKHLKIK